MVRKYVRTCDFCHREVVMGQFVRRDAEPDGMDLLMILIANQGRDIEFDENPDGTIPVDTCLDCAGRMVFEYSHALN